MPLKNEERLPEMLNRVDIIWLKADFIQVSDGSTNSICSSVVRNDRGTVNLKLKLLYIPKNRSTSFDKSHKRLDQIIDLQHVT